MIALYAMWFVHLRLFTGTGFAAWIGFAVVTQNFVGSLLNSHLFDSAEGWIYVFGVGIAGGMVLRERDSGCWRKTCFPAISGGRGVAGERKPNPGLSMIRLLRLTWRNVLIIAHDAVVTGLAVVAAFYLRFETPWVAERGPFLATILPWFVLYSIAVCYAFRLPITKWRFTSLPEL